MLRPINQMRRAIWKALSHDVLTLSKSAAYSATLGLFPALLVVTTVLALVPSTLALTSELRGVLTDFLPGDTMSVVRGYFQVRHQHTLQAIVSAVLVSIFGNLGVMGSFMEGFRRAYDLPRNSRTAHRQRLVALGLVPSCLVPMACATLLVAFGHQIENWIVLNADHEFQSYVLVMWRVTRWVIGVGTTATVLSVVYHFGTPGRPHWRTVFPGALVSALLWFVTTLVFGWYVTRFADYSVVYGPLGTAVATLVWLYITAFSVFIGAEYNAQAFHARGALAGTAVEENALAQAAEDRKPEDQKPEDQEPENQEPGDWQPPADAGSLTEPTDGELVSPATPRARRH
jgi:membrane protein